jgi:Ca2+-transporting ATPase
LEGAGVLLAVAAVYGYTLQHGAGAAEARAMAFATIIFGNVGLILSSRSRKQSILKTLAYPNGALWWVIIGALGALTAVLCVPRLRALFQLAPLSGDAVLVCFAAAALSLVWPELYKLWRYRRRDGGVHA